MLKHFIAIMAYLFIIKAVQANMEPHLILLINYWTTKTKPKKKQMKIRLNREKEKTGKSCA